MSSIGKKLKFLSRVLLIALFLLLACAAVCLFTGKEGLGGLLSLLGLEENGAVARYLPVALLAAAGVIVILLTVWTVRALGQAVDCLEDIADAQEETAKALRVLIERVEHLPVLQVGGRDEAPRKGNGPVSFRAPQQVFTTRENAKPAEKEAAPREKSAPEEPKKTRAEAGPENENGKQPASGASSAAPAAMPVAPSGIAPSEKWKCPGCGEINESKNEICSSCGEKSLWKCGRCGAVSSYSTDVCPACGVRATRPCPVCGNILPRNRLTCDVCHHDLS